MVTRKLFATVDHWENKGVVTAQIIECDNRGLKIALDSILVFVLSATVIEVSCF
jgi:hypothetical protein